MENTKNCTRTDDGEYKKLYEHYDGEDKNCTSTMVENTKNCTRTDGYYTKTNDGDYAESRKVYKYQVKQKNKQERYNVQIGKGALS